jgi:hypothetical protein
MSRGPGVLCQSLSWLSTRQRMPQRRTLRAGLLHHRMRPRQPLPSRRGVRRRCVRGAQERALTKTQRTLRGARLRGHRRRFGTGSQRCTRPLELCRDITQCRDHRGTLGARTRPPTGHDELQVGRAADPLQHTLPAQRRSRKPSRALPSPGRRVASLSHISTTLHRHALRCEWPDCPRPSMGLGRRH